MLRCGRVRAVRASLRALALEVTKILPILAGFLLYLAYYTVKSNHRILEDTSQDLYGSLWQDLEQSINGTIDGTIDGTRESVRLVILRSPDCPCPPFVGMPQSSWHSTGFTSISMYCCTQLYASPLTDGCCRFSTVLGFDDGFEKPEAGLDIGGDLALESAKYKLQRTSNTSRTSHNKQPRDVCGGTKEPSAGDMLRALLKDSPAKIFVSKYNYETVWQKETWGELKDKRLLPPGFGTIMNQYQFDKRNCAVKSAQRSARSRDWPMQAPVEKYQQHTGSKTNFRVLNRSWQGKYADANPNPHHHQSRHRRQLLTLTHPLMYVPPPTPSRAPLAPFQPPDRALREPIHRNRRRTTPCRPPADPLQTPCRPPFRV
eukprot:174157-Prorocentrum_minimum.AAC.4